MKRARRVLICGLLIGGLLVFAMNAASDRVSRSARDSHNGPFRLRDIEPFRTFASWWVPEPMPPEPLGRIYHDPLEVEAGPTEAQASHQPRDGEAKVLPPESSMSVALEVLFADRPVPTIPYAGRTYLPVPRLGIDYEIRVWNHGPQRITAIVSVDGLSVINGQPAAEHHPGYIVYPHGKALIQGWRRDMYLAAAFTFEEREKSYASLIGRPEHIGVIGLVAIEEKDPSPGAAAVRSVMGSTGIDTGYGRVVDSPAYCVPFVRSGNKRTVTIYYDTVEALRRAGVPVPSDLPAAKVVGEATNKEQFR
jgi:hypothetical protein